MKFLSLHSEIGTDNPWQGLRLPTANSFQMPYLSSSLDDDEMKSMPVCFDTSSLEFWGNVQSTSRISRYLHHINFAVALNSAKLLHRKKGTVSKMKKKLGYAILNWFRLIST